MNVSYSSQSHCYQSAGGSRFTGGPALWRNRLLSWHSSRDNSYRWNIRKDAGGSSLLTGGCHALDALLLLMGTDVKEVTSYQTKSKSDFFAPYEYATSSVTILNSPVDGLESALPLSIACSPIYFHTAPLWQRRQLIG